MQLLAIILYHADGRTRRLDFQPGALNIVDAHWLMLAALLKRYGYEDPRFARVIEEHQHLIQSIERRDAHCAATLMGAHIEKAKNNLLVRAASETAAQSKRTRR